jgi:hypothetical protein
MAGMESVIQDQLRINNLQLIPTRTLVPPRVIIVPPEEVLQQLHRERLYSLSVIKGTTIKGAATIK